MFTDNFYKDFYNSSPVGFFTSFLDDGTIVKTNDAFAKIMGFNEAKDIEGLKMSEFYSQLTRKQLVDTLLKNKQVSDFEIKLVLPNGTSRWITIYAQIDRDSKHFHGIVIDIEDRVVEEEYQSYAKTSDLALVAAEAKKRCMALTFSTEELKI